MKTLKLKDGDLCFENGELQMVEGDAEPGSISRNDP